MHYLAALVAVAALVLYADRTGRLYATGSQDPGAVVTRVGIAAVLLTLATGFLNLAVTGAPFAWRHWLTLAALAVTVAGHVWMRVTHSPPT